MDSNLKAITHPQAPEQPDTVESCGLHAKYDLYAKVYYKAAILVAVLRFLALSRTTFLGQATIVMFTSLPWHGYAAFHDSLGPGNWVMVWDISFKTLLHTLWFYEKVFDKEDPHARPSRRRLVLHFWVRAMAILGLHCSLMPDTVYPRFRPEPYKLFVVNSLAVLDIICSALAMSWVTALWLTQQTGGYDIPVESLCLCDSKPGYWAIGFERAVMGDGPEAELESKVGAFDLPRTLGGSEIRLRRSDQS